MGYKLLTSIYDVRGVISDCQHTLWEVYTLTLPMFEIKHMLHSSLPYSSFQSVLKKNGKYFLFETHESLWNRTTMNNIIRVTYVDKGCESENKLSKTNYIYIPSCYLHIQPSPRYNDFYSTAI